MAVHDAIIELEILTEKVLKAGAYDMAAPYRQSNARIILAELERLRKIEAAADAIYAVYNKHGECDVVGAELNRAMDAYGELSNK